MYSSILASCSQEEFENSVIFDWIQSGTGSELLRHAAKRISADRIKKEKDFMNSFACCLDQFQNLFAESSMINRNQRFKDLRCSIGHGFI